MTTTTIPPSRTTGVPPGQRAGTLYTFIGLLERDWRVMRREFVTVVARSAVQPIFFVLIFGYLLPKIGTVSGEKFGPILFPGILAMSTILSGMQSVTMPIAIDLGFVREIDDRVLCPIRVEWIGVEKILFGAFQAALSAAVVFPIALFVMGDIVHVHVADTPAIVAVILAASVMSAALGLFIGTIVPARQLALVFSVVLTPLIFLGCTQYSWPSLSVVPWLQVLVLVNPLVYASEAMRAVLTPDLAHMAGWAIVLGVTAATVLFGWLGIRRFRARALE
jgi:ABC-2 type transport system permease protein